MSEEEEKRELNREELWQQATPWERNVVEVLEREGYAIEKGKKDQKRGVNNLEASKDGKKASFHLLSTPEIKEIPATQKASVAFPMLLLRAAAWLGIGPRLVVVTSATKIAASSLETFQTNSMGLLFVDQEGHSEWRIPLPEAPRPKLDLQAMERDIAGAETPEELQHIRQELENAVANVRQYIDGALESFRQRFEGLEGFLAPFETADPSMMGSHAVLQKDLTVVEDRLMELQTGQKAINEKLTVFEKRVDRWETVFWVVSVLGAILVGAALVLTGLAVLPEVLGGTVVGDIR